MGMFPYECDKCRGGDFRCGNKFCSIPNCKGSQFCWDNNVIIILIKESKTLKFEVEYDGYGKVYVDTEEPGNDWQWEDFGLTFGKEMLCDRLSGQIKEFMFINLNDYSNNVKRNKDIAKIYCKSCY